MEKSNDIWDDELLIKAYEKAIGLQRSEVAKTLANNTNKNVEDAQIEDDSTDGDSDKSYKVGDFVRATYDVDGIDYEAEIISIGDSNDSCMVKFIGYNNEQSVQLADLIDSWGEDERNKQLDEADTDDTEIPNDEVTSNTNQASTFPSMRPMPPMPPLPPLLETLSTDDAEHFSAMLMSWFMSGYYTGLYQGFKQGRTQSRKNNRNKPSSSKRT